MDAEIDKQELAGCYGRQSSSCAMSTGAAVFQVYGTLLVATKEAMSPDKLGVGSGSGWMDDVEEPPETKQRRTVHDRPSCKGSEFGKMLANETVLLDPVTREAKHFVNAASYRIKFLNS